MTLKRPTLIAGDLLMGKSGQFVALGHYKGLYARDRRVHAVKFQSVEASNGLIGNLYGRLEGRCHESGMLADSGLLPQLQLYSRSPLGNPLCIYGDLKYPLRPQLPKQFRGLHLFCLCTH